MSLSAVREVRIFALGRVRGLMFDVCSAPAAFCLHASTTPRRPRDLEGLDLQPSPCCPAVAPRNASGDPMLLPLEGPFPR